MTKKEALKHIASEVIEIKSKLITLRGFALNNQVPFAIKLGESNGGYENVYLTHDGLWASSDSTCLDLENIFDLGSCE